MPTLAPKLPWTHAFAGGYPRVAGQALPTDPDAIDYLNRVAAADGAAVEVGVAMAVDAFVKGCKADGIWDALKASCIMCGARTISGALVPLVGPSPTAYPQPVNFVSADYDRSSGLKGDGSTKYLDTNRDSDADGQNDCHLSVYETLTHSDGGNFGASIGALAIGTGQKAIVYRTGPLQLIGRLNDFNNSSFARASTTVGFTAVSRDNANSLVLRYGGTNNSIVQPSAAMDSRSTAVFCQDNGSGVQNFSNARLAFYSIGSALDLAALDNRVSTLVAAIAAAL